MVGAANGNLALLLPSPSVRGIRIFIILVSVRGGSGPVGARLERAGGAIKILLVSEKEGAKVTEERQFGVMNLCKKLLADALVQWRVRQHLRSKIIIRHRHSVDDV